MNFQKYYLANLTLSVVDQGNSPTLSPSINTRVIYRSGKDRASRRSDLLKKLVDFLSFIGRSLLQNLMQLFAPNEATASALASVGPLWQG